MSPPPPNCENTTSKKASRQTDSVPVLIFEQIVRYVVGGSACHAEID